MIFLNRLPESERNKTNTRQMRAYMQALLEVSGLLAGEAFELRAMLGNFGTHMDAGRFESVADGKVRLTTSGREYFSERLLSGAVTREEIIEMIRNITAETPPPNWVTLAVKLAESA